MPNITGADPRQSRTLASLVRFTPGGITALACIGLALSEALEHRYLVVNDSYPADIADRTKRGIRELFPLLDALHGASGQIPAALAAFLAVMEGAANHG